MRTSKRCAKKTWDPRLALEGLFIQVALNLLGENASATWSWEESKAYILEIIKERDADLLQVLLTVAKDNSDHLGVSTSNKVWHAHWTRCCADMLAQQHRK